MNEPLTLDFSKLTDQFSTVQLHTLFKKREVAKKNFKQKIELGEIGFSKLPYQKNLSELKKVAKKISQTCDTLLVIGIGGSSLGAKAALHALKNSKTPKIYFLENPNPDTLNHLLETIDLKKTAINVISKSGSTLETLSIFFIIFEKLKNTISPKELKERVIVTTEPKENFLNTIAKEYSLPLFPIPFNVGGRYSVLSPVGLFPMLVAGISIDDLLEGAQWVDQHNHDAYFYGTLAYGAHRLLKKPLTVLFPYDERLSTLGDWFCQLWAESLAKSDSSGPTPLKAIGTQDQHSLLQLFLQGPQDKWYTLITLEKHEHHLNIPNSPILKNFSYLKNIPLENILKAEEKATEKSLTEFENPFCRISLPELSAYTLGALFYHFELATAISGFLYEINPFDQPAVENGKKWAIEFLQNKQVR
ncbi:MAG: hypothetical protein A2Z91_09490 [Deltaproteobacteria bacterium GWA2_38_16]|nr:MAG: hypothetical protein A2Z91_09490 [Deltaproteobacteria bacterium GWA2_38_16]HBQ21073.1 glucose-6-phosphate isomerase [Deltaproteobacteria bacterium]